MNAAAVRFLLGLAAVAFAAAGRLNAEAAVRVPPSRPAPLSTTLFGGTEYVSATDIAIRLGLKGTWTEPMHKLTLADKTSKVELKADNRDILVNGLRVFLGDKTVLQRGQLYVSRIDFERCLTPLLRPGFGVELPPTPKIIALDPGHGGLDEGTENKTVGLKEKLLTLDVALRLRKLLEAAGYKVVMIRTDDQPLSPIKPVDLALRPEFANRARADLFISIHFNAAPKDTRGTEVFTYAPKTQHSADWWGLLKKDDADVEATEQPANRLDHWNVVFAQALQRELLQALQTEDRGKKIAHWAVLKTLNCPGVLVEPAIISNDAEARRVAVPEFRQQIAEALLAGVRDYAAMLEALRPAEAKPPGTVTPQAAPQPAISK